MKKIVLLVFMTIPLVVLAQQRKYTKYIKKLDVVKYLPEQCDSNPATFWKCIVENNEDFQKSMKPFENPKGFAKKAKKTVNNYIKQLELFRSKHVATLDEERITMLFREQMFGDGDNYGMFFDFAFNDESNAYCTPDGHVYINTGLLDRIHSDFVMECGIVAHEICHYLHNHMLICEYSNLKTERNNNILAAIGITLTAVGNFAAASQGVEKDYSENEYSKYIDLAKEETLFSKYKFKREQEIAADIVAYRFLEWIGLDPSKYIEALERIDPYYMKEPEEKESDHPTTEFRVELLKTLKDFRTAKKGET